MTKEEIKENTAMRDVLRRYGLPEPNRSGFIACPFHKGDREPSMKIYEKDYHCYACGENGDIFTFVERMEGIPFREAFLSLGGTYSQEEETPFARKLRVYRRRMEKEAVRKRRLLEGQEKRELIRQTDGLWWCIRLYPPLSEPWCDAYNAWQKAVYRLEYLNGGR